MRLSIFLAGLTGLRLLLSTLSQLFVVTLIGVGFRTDALVAGSILPQLAVLLAATSLSQVLVPLFASETRTSISQNAWTIFVLLLTLFGFVAGVLFLSAGVWVRWLTPGFNDEGVALAIQLTRIQLFGMVFSVPCSVLWSLQCAQGKLLRAEAAMVISVTVTSIFVILSVPHYGVIAAAMATVLRPALDVFLLAPGLGRPANVFGSSYLLHKVWQRLRYLLIGSAYSGTDPFISQFLTSYAQPGSMTAYFAGQQVFNYLTQMVNRSVAAPILPVLALEAHSGRWIVFRQICRRRTLIALVLSGVVMAGLLLLGHSGLALLVGKGNFTQASVDLLWTTLVGLFGMCLGGFATQVLVNGMHAMGNTKTPTKLGMAIYTLYVPVKIAAFALYGLTGLTLATSAFFMLHSLGLWVCLNRAVRPHLQEAV